MNTIDDKYEVLQRIKEGGMGAIYKVRHRLLDEIRVVKVMRPHASQDPDLQRRFLREAKMAIRVRHPNIGQLYDFSIDDEGTAVIVMEFIDGVTLQEVLESGPAPSLPFVVDVAIQVLQALSCLHFNGIVHRDVASDNVMLARSFDGRPLVKLIDLGIAKDPAGDATATVSGAFVGKARYAAPEQFQGARASGPTPATDIYSFGVLMYELLTGRMPIEGWSFAELAAGHLFRSPIPFSETDPGGRVPQGLRELVMLALEKDPAHRIASAEALAEKIRPFGAAAPLDPSELDRLLDRARAAASGPPAGPAATKPTLPAARVEAIIDALSAPPSDPATIELIEATHDFAVTPPATGLPEPKLQPRAVSERRPLIEDEEERGEDSRVVTPPPRRQMPRRRREAMEEAEEARPRRRPMDRSPRPGSGLWRAALIGIGALALGLGGYAAWITLRDPFSGQVAAVQNLPAGTQEQISDKLNRVVALVALLPADDSRRKDLENEADRLTNLLELHRYRDRLKQLLASAASPDVDADKARLDATDAENLWILMREYRHRFLDQDLGAAQVEDSGRDLLRRIGERTASKRLESLAKER